MALSALIVVKLSGATEEQKGTFTKALAENNVNKLPQLPTTYEVNFSEEASREDAQKAIDIVVQEAATKAKVKKCKIAFQLGDSPVDLMEL